MSALRTSSAPLKAFSAYGIELEYMIVASDTLSVRPIADELLREAVGYFASEAARGRFTWSNELALHLIEVRGTRPEPSLRGLAAGFHGEIRVINELLAACGARLMPTAMHPWMDPVREGRLWPHQGAAIYGAYDRIFDCRGHGWVNMQSMHLNLPFANDVEFARLHAAIRLLLPILPALAASSPVADGRARSELDYRLECYRAHPLRVPSVLGALIPDNTSSQTHFATTVLAPMYREIAPHDAAGLLQHEWLNARGAIPRFDRQAIEIRLLDVQECPQADLAIAALVSAALRGLYAERWSRLDDQQAMETGALRDILLACIRDADRAVIDNPAYLARLGFAHPRCEAGDLWRHLREACRADPALDQTDLAPLDVIQTQGPLARRIVRALGPNFNQPRLQAVYRTLCDCLAEGRPFTGVAE